MVTRLIPFIVVLIIIGLAYVVYQRWVAARAANTGNVQLLGDTGSSSGVSVDKAPASPVTPAASTTTVTTQTTQPAATTTYSMPTTDSIPANPPNNMIFSGSGRYQLYRQGSITWRLDTNNGHTCIIFATDEEWRKARVYSHGCGNE
jgi:hypothetical protein